MSKGKSHLLFKIQTKHNSEFWLNRVKSMGLGIIKQHDEDAVVKICVGNFSVRCTWKGPSPGFRSDKPLFTWHCTGSWKHKSGRSPLFQEVKITKKNSPSFLLPWYLEYLQIHTNLLELYSLSTIWNNTQLLRKGVTFFKKSYFSFQENMEVGPLRKNFLGSFLENKMAMGYYICHLLVLS